MAIRSDDFTTDPATRWTVLAGAAFAHDGTDGEMDVDISGVDPILRHDTLVGDAVAQECQVTCLLTSTHRNAGPAVRVSTSGAVDGYGAWWAGSNTVTLSRFDAGVRTNLGNFALTAAAGDWITIRLRAENVAGDTRLSVFGVNHSTTKPVAQPDWQTGSLGTAVTDAAATDLAEARHEACGLASRLNATDYDTRHDWWIARINDEVAGGGVVPVLIHSQRLNAAL